MKFNKITDKRPEALHDNHMPKSYDISLKAYGGGGTAKSLNPKPKKLKHQSMKGFEDQYKNIIDYIVRITYQIWDCLLYTSPSPRDRSLSRMPSSA